MKCRMWESPPTSAFTAIGQITKSAAGKNVLLDWSVNPIQQYSYTAGKNATDSAMIIDAMDILYSG